LKIPVFCKIRILPDTEKTMQLIRGIEDAGCWLLTVHGRTKEQNKHMVGTCDWDTIRDIKKTLRIPVFANGGIHKFEDIQRCIDHTGVDGVMSAESLLENPALFSGEVKCLDTLAEEYLDLWEKHDKTHPKYLKPHLFKMLHMGLAQYTDLREQLGSAKGVEECRKVVNELKERRKEVALQDKFGWYERYQSYAPMKDLPKILQKKEKENENTELNGNDAPEKKLKTA
jgi:tRNA-dihydrouridine synthase 1